VIPLRRLENQLTDVILQDKIVFQCANGIPRQLVYS